MASKNHGWVRIYRDITENALWASDEPFDRRSAWIDLILMANHEDAEIVTKRGEVLKIPRGSLLTSIQKLAERWHWSKGKVVRYTETLKELGMITKTGTLSGTLLSLVKYKDFQDRRNADGYADRYADGYADGSRTRMNKNEKNEKKRASAPSSLEERFAAIERFAREGGK